MSMWMTPLIISMSQTFIGNFVNVPMAEPSRISKRTPCAGQKIWNPFNLPPSRACKAWLHLFSMANTPACVRATSTDFPCKAKVRVPFSGISQSGATGIFTVSTSLINAVLNQSKTHVNPLRKSIFFGNQRCPNCLEKANMIVVLG